MHSANLVLWIAALGLQSLLVVMLSWRRLVRLFPVFSFLIAFYIFRSALYYMLSRPPLREHKDLYNVLSLTDLLLQILLVIEISVRSLAATERGDRPDWPNTLLRLAIEGVIAAAIAMLVPEPKLVRLDRGIVFVMILMTQRLVWMARRRIRGIPRSIAAGFAAYGVALTATTVTQNLAAESRNAVEFTAAAYVNAAVYVGIVVFWIVAIWGHVPGESPALKLEPKRAGARK